MPSRGCAERESVACALRLRSARLKGDSIELPATYVVYILLCADGSLYTGMTTGLDLRMAEHQQGVDSTSYTYSRRPVEFVWSVEFRTHDEAFRCEKQIKGWGRAKKRALIAGDLKGIHEIVRGEWEREHVGKTSR